MWVQLTIKALDMYAASRKPASGHANYGMLALTHDDAGEKMKIVLTLAAIGLFASPAAAEDVSLKIVNSSSQAVSQFFTSPTEVNEWEEDVFGEDVLPAGHEVDVVVADGREQCVYDIKFIMQDGQELIDTINLCNSPTYELVEK